jgi:hypothetical protein
MSKLSLCVLLIAPIMVSPAISDEMNLATCLMGAYSDICNHDLLTEEQAKKVEQAELQTKYKVNLEICSLRLYSKECDSNALTNDDYIKIDQKYASKPRNNQNESLNKSLEESSRSAWARKTTGTNIRNLDYTVNFGRGNPYASGMIEGSDRRQLNAQRDLDRAYDKAIGNVRESSTNTAPNGFLIDPFSGNVMPRTGAGYTDPMNGTFYHDVGGGVVNTRTGEFTPTHK